MLIAATNMNLGLYETFNFNTRNQKYHRNKSDILFLKDLFLTKCNFLRVWTSLRSLLWSAKYKNMCAYFFWKKNPPCALLLGPVRLIKFQKKILKKKRNFSSVLWNSRLREPFSAFFRENNCLHLGHGTPRAPCAQLWGYF